MCMRVKGLCILSEIFKFTEILVVGSKVILFAAIEDRAILS